MRQLRRDHKPGFKEAHLVSRARILACRAARGDLGKGKSPVQAQQRTAE
jgi:hypothetical protein